MIHLKVAERACGQDQSTTDKSQAAGRPSLLMSRNSSVGNGRGGGRPFLAYVGCFGHLMISYPVTLVITSLSGAAKPRIERGSVRAPKARNIFNLRGKRNAVPVRHRSSYWITGSRHRSPTGDERHASCSPKHGIIKPKPHSALDNTSYYEHNKKM